MISSPGTRLQRAVRPTKVNNPEANGKGPQLSASARVQCQKQQKKSVETHHAVEGAYPSPHQSTFPACVISIFPIESSPDKCPPFSTENPRADTVPVSRPAL